MSVEPESADRLVRELDRLSVRTRRSGRAMATGLPLAAWGATWVVAYSAFALLEGVPRVVVVALACAAATACSWLPTRRAMRTGRERPLRLGWVAFLLASPFLLTAVGPGSVSGGALFLGGLWSLAMLIYALATADRWLAVVTGLGVVTSGVVRLQPWVAPTLGYGWVAGVPLLVLGLSRMVDRRD